jgi:prepilin-type N-terminal cleavage/methylation domain-containing protein
MKEKGFTLIELMVVISIIALLSVVVIAALGSARDRAKNTAKNELAMEYIKAIELYNSANLIEGYPIDTNSGNYICLGDWGAEMCQGFLMVQAAVNLD